MLGNHELFITETEGRNSNIELGVDQTCSTKANEFNHPNFLMDQCFNHARLP